ncbi:uncharacterized protein LOC114354203 [Ostrinia furnacalis]|uniref:uncharacterized protein LOC114354203 n=1 Tax=Ostrinia furnacalis TaxID=93504 RepID=UPI00103BF74D|nr:uncharacterized protein LOC114354203 [Ostrinia furnacalis]
MTKMNVDLPGMIGQQNLIVDDIFTDNFKRKKLQDEYGDGNLKKPDAFNNNNLKLINKEISPKRKTSKNIEDNYVNTELNISIDKDSNRTIRLELRHPGSDSDYKNGHRDDTNDHRGIENGIEEYSLKDGVDVMERDENSEDMNRHDDYANGNDEENDEHKANLIP